MFVRKYIRNKYKRAKVKCLKEIISDIETQQNINTGRTRKQIKEKAG